MSALDVHNFRVMFQITGMKKSTIENHVAENLGVVMATLKTQGVTKNTVDFLVVHQLLADGRVAELVDINNKKKDTTSNVVSIESARTAKKPVEEKPRVKLPAPVEAEETAVFDLMYRALPARAWEIAVKEA